MIQILPGISMRPRTEWRLWRGPHDQLYQGFDIERMDIGKYIETVCKDLNASGFAI